MPELSDALTEFYDAYGTETWRLTERGTLVRCPNDRTLPITLDLTFFSFGQKVGRQFYSSDEKRPFLKKIHHRGNRSKKNWLTPKILKSEESKMKKNFAGKRKCQG